MKYNSFSRRMFLRGVGGSLLPIPFLGSLLPSSAFADGDSEKRYYVAIISNYGIGRHQNWVPSLSQPSQLFRGQESHNIYYDSLSSYLSNSSDPLSKVYGSDLNAYISKMNILMGLDSPLYGGHNMSHILGNFLGSLKMSPLGSAFNQTYMNESIDQLISKSSSLNPGRNPPIFVGGSSGSTQGSASFRRSVDGMIAGVSRTDTTPEGVFSKVFPAFLPEPGMPDKNKLGGEILNQVMDDYRSIISGRKISSDEKKTLTRTMDMYSDLEKTLKTTLPTQCQYSTIDVTSKDYNHGPNSVYSAYVKIIAMAFQCDLTRSAVIIPTVTAPSTYGDFHQNISHDPFGTFGSMVKHEILAQEQNRIIKYVVKPLVELLDSTTDPSNGKSFLENSLVHVTSENAIVHDHYSIPTLLIGGLNGKMATGKYIDFRDKSKKPHGAQQHSDDPNSPKFTHSYPGVMYSRLLYTIASKIGLKGFDPTEVNSHLRGLTDGILGEINNGISIPLKGYGNILPPSYAYKSIVNYRQLGRSVQNYDLRLSGVPLPLI